MIGPAYYNEFDPYAAQTLRNLIAAGHIAPGVVDSRSIEDVKPAELAPFTQCHFFAGVGVWSAALRAAGWPDDRPVWTGSCPCQPFSAAGEGVGFDDERHLWPTWQWLIANQKRRPVVIFGEQVASKDANPWIDLVHTDLENMGYAFGAVAFPSAGIGAPHIRDRTYWMADSGSARLEKCERFGGIPGGTITAATWEAVKRGGVCAAFGLADPSRERVRTEEFGTVGTTAQRMRGTNGQWEWVRPDIGASSSTESSRPGPVNGLWSTADWLLCRDGKWRPVEPSTFPLANGAPARVGRLRAYGNAINLEAARHFVECYLEL